MLTVNGSQTNLLEEERPYGIELRQPSQLPAPTARCVTEAISHLPAQFILQLSTFVSPDERTVRNNTWFLSSFGAVCYTAIANYLSCYYIYLIKEKSSLFKQKPMLQVHIPHCVFLKGSHLIWTCPPVFTISPSVFSLLLLLATFTEHAKPFQTSGPFFLLFSLP